MESNTKILRRLLDERGVEWDYGITGATTTRFSVNGIDLTYTPMRDGLVCSTILTPAQAIAATLGATDARPTQEESSGTCHVESSIIDTYLVRCWEYELSCGHTIIWEDNEPPNYCPICGRRIEQ